VQYYDYFVRCVGITAPVEIPSTPFENACDSPVAGVTAYRRTANVYNAGPHVEHSISPLKAGQKRHEK
jgi:hypothetical protein